MKRLSRSSGQAMQMSGATAKPLMHLNEVVGLKQAMALTGLGEITIRRWCRLYPIATQTTHSAPLRISRVALAMAAAGDHDALRRYVDGDRSSIVVRRYIDEAGVEVLGDNSLYALFSPEVMAMFE